MGEVTRARRRRLVVDLAVLVAIGLLMGFLGPFDSERIPAPHRYAYWMSCMVGGGLVAPVSRTYAPVLRDAGWF